MTSLEEMQIEDCNNIYDIETIFDIEIIKFESINKIKSWYRRRKDIIKFDKLIHWIEQNRMHPDSQYCKNLINGFD